MVHILIYQTDSYKYIMNLSVLWGRDIGDSVYYVSVTTLTLAVPPFLPMTGGRDSGFRQRQVDTRFEDIG